MLARALATVAVLGMVASSPALAIDNPGCYISPVEEPPVVPVDTAFEAAPSAPVPTMPAVVPSATWFAGGCNDPGCWPIELRATPKVAPLVQPVSVMLVPAPSN